MRWYSNPRNKQMERTGLAVEIAEDAFVGVKGTVVEVGKEGRGSMFHGCVKVRFDVENLSRINAVKDTLRHGEHIPSDAPEMWFLSGVLRYSVTQ